MHIARAVQIANERRALAGLPPITVIASKKTPEYAEVYRIMHESEYRRIEVALSNMVRTPEQKAEGVRAMKCRGSVRVVT